MRQAARFNATQCHRSSMAPGNFRVEALCKCEQDSWSLSRASFFDAAIAWNDLHVYFVLLCVGSGQFIWLCHVADSLSIKRNVYSSVANINRSSAIHVPQVSPITRFFSSIPLAPPSDSCIANGTTPNSFPTKDDRKSLAGDAESERLERASRRKALHAESDRRPFYRQW